MSTYYDYSQMIAYQLMIMLSLSVILNDKVGLVEYSLGQSHT